MIKDRVWPTAVPRDNLTARGNLTADAAVTLRPMPADIDIII